MSNRDGVVAYSARDKLTPIILIGLAFVFGSILILGQPVPDWSCVQHYAPECGRKPLRAIISHYVAWASIPLFSLGLLKIFAMHASGAPYISISASGIRCRGWGETVAWTDIKSVQPSAIGTWTTPKSWRTRELQLKVLPRAARTGFWPWLAGALTYITRDHNPVSGKYRVVLSYLDEHPDVLMQEIRARLDPSTIWLD